MTATKTAWLLGIFMLVAPLTASTAQETDAAASEAFRVFAKEQSLAESYVVLLNTIGKKDVANYAEGIRLYADAKAEFDGLIEQLKFDLVHRQPIDASEKWQAELATAVSRRLAFTHHVDEMVAALGSGTKGLSDYIKGAAELISALTEAGTAIWDRYWGVQETLRTETIAQLDALKWKPFSELPGGP